MVDKLNLMNTLFNLICKLKLYLLINNVSNLTNVLHYITLHLCFLIGCFTTFTFSIKGF